MRWDEGVHWWSTCSCNLKLNFSSRVLGTGFPWNWKERWPWQNLSCSTAIRRTINKFKGEIMKGTSELHQSFFYTVTPLVVTSILKLEKALTNPIKTHIYLFSQITSPFTKKKSSIYYFQCFVYSQPSMPPFFILFKNGFNPFLLFCLHKNDENDGTYKRVFRVVIIPLNILL